MSMGSDYVQVAHGLIADHLQSNGLRAKVVRDRVQLGFGGLTAAFRIESIEASGNTMQMVYWATIDGLKGIDPPRMELDLMGLGPDSLEALTDGVHVFLDQVIPVLRTNADPSKPRKDVQVVTASSVTDGRSTAWDLLMGPPGVGGDGVDDARRAIGDLILFQGILDSLVPVMSEVRPHWYKLIIGRTADGSFVGDMRIDGQLVGLTSSFDSPKWPEGFVIVRQFGMLRPSKRPIDESDMEMLRAAHGEPSRRSWRNRLVRP